MDHLINCHGEWNLLLTGLGALPLVGVWLRVYVAHLETALVPARAHRHDHPHE